MFERVLHAGEIAQVIEALFAASLPRTKAGARHVLQVPEVRTMANAPRLMAIARTFVGDGATPFRATLFDKSPDGNWLVAWHQDRALPLRARFEAGGWGPWSTKDGVIYAHAPAWALECVVALRVSLDPSTTSNGPLRVLPSSHRRGVLSDEEIRRCAGDTDPVDCITDAGGVVAMQPLTVHASSKARPAERRRVLHVEYAESLTLAPGIDLAVS